MSEVDDAILAALKGVSGIKRSEVLQLLKGETKVKRVRREIDAPCIPEPYSVVYEMQCRTCGTVQEQYFNMVRDEVRGCLMSVATQIRPGVFVTMKRERACCAQCKETLMSMTKEEIVERFMRVMQLIERLL